MNGRYLVPANSNKSKLFLGLFKGRDIIVLVVGLLVTIILLVLFQGQGPLASILAIVPVVIAGFLIIPLPNYHNVMQFIINVVTFVFNQRTYKWKGWCVKDEFKQ